MDTIIDLFLLDPDVIFLNHGSFGACPRPVFEAYQAWQRRLEFQPVLFLGRAFAEYDFQSRRALGEYLHADPNDLAYLPNATVGVNLIARSVRLQPGDEILTTDHEYGACDKTWEFICQKTGAVYLHQPIPLPAGSFEQVVETIWEGVTPRTKLIFLSHITSPTALRLPVEAICARARRAGILTLIDGAHAPGQIDLDLQAIDADFYTGNLHKWFMCPKGAAFLYTRREKQHLVEPLVISWGWQADAVASTGSTYIDHLQWQGTRDPSAYLAVPAAIQFLADHNWPAIRLECQGLVHQALQRIHQITGLPPVYATGHGYYYQMAVAPLPLETDLVQLQERLYGEYRIEIPCLQWQQQKLLRISVQGYNSQEDIDALVYALEKLLLRR